MVNEIWNGSFIIEGSLISSVSSLVAILKNKQIIIGRDFEKENINLEFHLFI